MASLTGTPLASTAIKVGAWALIAIPIIFALGAPFCAIATASQKLFHQSFGSCSTHPACRYLVGYSALPWEIMWPVLSTRTALVAVVPTSTPSNNSCIS